MTTGPRRRGDLADRSRSADRTFWFAVLTVLLLVVPALAASTVYRPPTLRSAPPAPVDGRSKSVVGDRIHPLATIPSSSALYRRVHADPRLGSPVEGVAASPRPAQAWSTSAQIREASRTLAAGKGPAAGAPFECTASVPRSATCSTSQRPSASAEGWQNATSGADRSGSPPSGYGGAMAYDAADGYVVFFGGDTGADFLAQTWLFSNGQWTNATAGLANAPPAEAWPAMDFDSVYGVVLLFGGCSAAACPNNYTWYYSGAYGWTNLSASLSGSPPGLFAASLAFASDQADQVSVLEGGCLDRSCTNASNVTYAFAGTGWIALPNGSSPPAGHDRSVAYDATLGELVLFGGCNGVVCADDRTWTFFNFSWTDRTGALASVGPTPPGRSDAVLTWDELDRALVLFGGTGSARLLDDTWELACGTGGCAWRNVTDPRESPPPLTDALAPSDSNGSAGTMLYGGDLTGTGAPRYSNETFVFEPPLAIAPTVGPLAPARSTVIGAANPSGGSGAYSALAGQYTAIWHYDQTVANGVNTTFNFTEPGSYGIFVTVFDRFGVSASARVTYVATGPTSTILGGTAAWVGQPFSIAATPATDGHAPYAYRWTFGDGASADGASVNHTWLSPGVFVTTLFVVDASGVVFSISEQVSVTPAPAVSIAVSHPIADAGESVGFFPLVTGFGGSVTYVWDFADGSLSSVVPSPVHAFSRPGSYNVTLGVSNGSGASVRAWFVIAVYLPVGGSISASPADGVVGAAETFEATPAGGVPPYSFAWEFGDGGSGSGAPTSHRYSSPANFSARVWINDSVGGSFNTSVSVPIAPPGPGPSGISLGPDTAALALVGLLVIAAGAVAAVLWRRRAPPAVGPGADAG